MSNPIADVLIVGAGPLGLTAAVVLEQLGHDRLRDERAIRAYERSCIT
ncbi:FAD-dependent monooxygenase [Nocardia asiatica]